MNPAVRRLLLSIAITAGATYFLDPASGRRRRDTVRGRVEGTASKLNDRTRATRNELSQRAQRLAGQGKALFKRDKTSDQGVARCVRTTVRSTVSRPGVIGVASREGRVILHGDVLPHEHEQLVKAVRSMEGVIDVTDHLTERDSGDNAGSSQVASSPLPPRRFDLRREQWPPLTRLLIGATGGVLVANAARQRNLLGMLGGVVGAPLLARSATNTPLKRLGRGHGVIDIHKSIEVNAPVDRVFALLSSYENFPAFMRNIREVRRQADGSTHWVVAGPARSTVEWDSVTTIERPNEMLGWRSLPGSQLEHSGVMRFEPIGDQQTRVDVHMSYSPPAGALGHVVAKLFSTDARTEMDEDLARAKRFVETWKSLETDGATRDAQSEAAEGPGRAGKRRRANAGQEDTGMHAV